MIGVNVGRLFNPSRTPLGSSVPANTLLTGLLSYYKYDENTGTSVGDSKGTATGTFNGTGTLWAPGKINSGGNFTAANTNYVLSTISSGLSGSFTFNCWFKLTATGLAINDAPLMSSRIASIDNYWAELNTTSGTHSIQGQLFDGTNNPFITGTTSELSAGIWNMATFVRDTSQTKLLLYFNGVSNATPVTDTATPGVYSDFTMGGRHTAGTVVGHLTDGNIDEAGIWSVALSQANITALYNGGAGLSFTNFH